MLAVWSFDLVAVEQQAVSSYTMRSCSTSTTINALRCLLYAAVPPLTGQHEPMTRLHELVLRQHEQASRERRSCPVSTRQAKFA